MHTRGSEKRSSNSRLHCRVLRNGKTTTNKENIPQIPKAPKKIKLEQQELKEDGKINDEKPNEDTKITKNLDPLTMEDILDVIFCHLDMKSLKMVRQINKLWEKYALKRMLNIGFVSVPKTYYKMSKKKQEQLLNEIKPFISSEMNKIQNIELHDEDDDEKDVQVLRTLNILGPQVKQLKLPSYSSASKHKKLIVEELVNLNHLICLDKFGLCPQDLTMILDFNKNLIISNVLFVTLEDNARSASLNILEKFSKGLVKVKKLQIDSSDSILKNSSIWPRVSQILYQLLVNNYETLEEIRLSSPIGFIPGFEFPVLPNVKKFACSLYPVHRGPAYCDFLCRGRLLPSNFRFIEHLPNLTQVEFLVVPSWSIRYGNQDDVLNSIWPKLFENAGIAPKVEVIEYTNEIEPSNMNIFSTSFPHAKIIQS